MVTTQQCGDELPLREPDMQSFISELRKRLGHRSFVPLSHVASACDVSCATVKAWIDAGVIDALDISVTSRPYYRIFAPSVVRFYERRMENPS